MAYNTKELTMTCAGGTHNDAYRLLPTYHENLKKTNVNSITCLECTSENKFLRVFIAYSASIEGFASCRPLLGLDGITSKLDFKVFYLQRLLLMQLVLFSLLPMLLLML